MIILKPVGDGCNYRCVYCFHPEDLPVIQTMSLEVLEQVFRGLNEVFGDTCRILWHGGEPLMAGKRFFREAFALQKKIFGRVIHNSIQSNGSLLDEEWMEILTENSTSIGFSLDGETEINGRTRRNAGGQNGFEATVRGIRLVVDAGQCASVISVITRGRTDGREHYFFMRDLGISVVNINPCSDPRFSPTPEEHFHFVQEYTRAWVEDGGAGPRPRIFDFFLPMVLGQYSNGCVWSGKCHGMLEVQPDGRVKGFCDRNVDFAHFPAAYLGNLITDPPREVFNGNRILEFKRIEMIQPEACAGCPLAWTCRGGCLHHRLEMLGSLSQPDPYCEYYQRLFAFLQSLVDQVRDFTSPTAVEEGISDWEGEATWPG